MWTNIQETTVANPWHQLPQRQSVAKNRESKHDTKESEGNMLIQYSKRMFRDRNIQKGSYLQNQNYLVAESPDMQIKINRMAMKSQ